MGMCGAMFALFNFVEAEAKPGRHINIGELRSLVKAEELGASLEGDCRYATRSDSQVAIGAVQKGRSASPALNQILRHSLPCILGYGVYSFSGYIPSALNPCDDPTRGVPDRQPDTYKPDWWIAVEQGDPTVLDRLLREFGLSSEQLAGRPKLSELTAPICEAVDVPKRGKLNSMHRKVKAKLVNRALAKKKPKDSTEDESRFFQLPIQQRNFLKSLNFLVKSLSS